MLLTFISPSSAILEGIGNPTAWRLVSGERSIEGRFSARVQCDPTGIDGEQTAVWGGAGRACRLAWSGLLGARSPRDVHVSCSIRRRETATTAPAGRRRRVAVGQGRPSRRPSRVRPRWPDRPRRAGRGPGWCAAARPPVGGGGQAQRRMGCQHTVVAVAVPAWRRDQGGEMVDERQRGGGQRGASVALWLRQTLDDPVFVPPA